MSDYKVLATVRDLTGYIIRLHDFEFIENSLIGDDQMLVLINRAKWHNSREGFTITKRGRQLYQFAYTPETGRQLKDSVTLWWSTSETYTSRVAPLPRKEDA